MPAPDVVTFTTDLASPSTYTPEELVGRVYDVGINGVGYMLADDPNRQVFYQRGAIPLDPQRLATSDTPFAQSIDRYLFAVYSDLSAGAGQHYLNRGDSTSTMFLDSQGVDPFKVPGRLSLLPAVDHILTSAYTNQLMAVVGDDLYVVTADDELSYSPDGTTWQTITGLTDISGPVTISGFTSDGARWYAATGRSIIRESQNGKTGSVLFQPAESGIAISGEREELVSPGVVEVGIGLESHATVSVSGLSSQAGADFSTLAAVDVLSTAGRIVAAVKANGSSTPNRFTSITKEGFEEIDQGHLTLDNEHTIVLGGTAGGAVYFGAYAGSSGVVYAWHLGLDSASNFYTPFVAWEMPPGLIPAAVGVAGGNVWVRAFEPEGPTAGRALMYRCVPSSDGSLTPFLVAELADLGGTLDMSGSSMAATGDYVFFGWPSMHPTASGIGAVSLVSGGYAKWLESTVLGQVTDVTVWHGRPVFSIAGSGIWREADTFLTSGWVETSYADGATTLHKVWDDVTIDSVPLGTNESIQVEYTGDEGGSFTDAGTSLTLGSVRQQFELGLKLPSLGLRITLNGDGSTTPTLTAAQTRYHQLGLADEILVLPIDCADSLKGLNGRPLEPSGPNTGAARARTLEGLAQTRVLVQDVDWHITGATYIYEALRVEIKGVGVYDRHQSGKAWRLIATMTLRKAGIG